MGLVLNEEFERNKNSEIELIEMIGVGGSISTSSSDSGSGSGNAGGGAGGAGTVIGSTDKIERVASNNIDEHRDESDGDDRWKGKVVFYMDTDETTSKGGESALTESIYSAALLCPLYTYRTGEVEEDHVKTSNHKDLPKRNTDGATGISGLCFMDPNKNNDCSFYACCVAYVVVSGPWLLLLLINCAIQGFFVYFIASLVGVLLNHAEKAAALAVQCATFTASSNTTTATSTTTIFAGARAVEGYDFTIGCSSTPPPTCPANSILQITAIATLTCYALGDLRETVNMMWWVMYMKTTPRTERLQIVRDVENGTDEIASGLSRWYKLFAYVFVVLPKFALGTLLWWYGASYVVMSDSNAELILNTVAVLFVLEIDDQMYIVTVPARVQKVFKALPPVTTGSGRLVSCNTYFGQWLNMGIIGGMSFAILWTNCRE